MNGIASASKANNARCGDRTHDHRVLSTTPYTRPQPLLQKLLNTGTPHELQQILQELANESRQMGMKMNYPIKVYNALIENVYGTFT